MAPVPDTPPTDPAREQQPPALRAPRVTVVAHGEMLVARKEHPSRNAALAEAAWLASVPGSGTVRLVGHEATTTYTEFVAGPTLRTCDLDEPHLATVFVSLAHALADLSDRGVHHGAVVPEHVLINGADAVLCSPATDDDVLDPTSDVRGLGRCVDAVVERWEAAGLPVDPTWSRLAEQLRSPYPPSPRRVARALVARAGKPTSNGQASTPVTDLPSASRVRAPAADESGPRLPVGLVLAAAFALVAVTGLALAAGGGEPTAPVFSVDGGEFAANNRSGIARGLDNRCPGQPAAVLLDGDDVVWVFDEAFDGARGGRLVQVPGATDVVIDAGNGACPLVVVTGPAGRIVLDLDETTYSDDWAWTLRPRGSGQPTR